MGEKPLTARELREALALVAAELRDMGTPPAALDDRAVLYAHRWGRLVAHLEGLGDPARAPYALRALRKHVGQEEVVPNDSPS
jgi:hypothetical protein